MSGLFRRARALRTRLDLLGELENDDFVLNIPDEEKQSVLSGIDSMLKDDRIRMDEGALRFVPGKRSFTLPLLLNLGAALILGLGTLVLLRVFDRNETAVVKREVGLESAEGKILERLRLKSETELSVKDREIADIRSLLSDLENQKNNLAEETEQKLAEREGALRKEFDALMAAERTRLSESGVTGNDLTVAMAAYEAELRGRFEADLSEVRVVAAAEQERRVAELDAQRSVYEGQMASADEERLRLREELETRTEELETLSQVSSTEAGEAARHLDDLRSLQEQEKLVTDQILAFYERIGVARRAGDADTAMGTLDSLEQYLSEDSIRKLGLVENRREVDAFLTAALRRLINLEFMDQSDVSVPDDGSTEILSGISAGAVAGMRLSESGDLETARQVWRDAFSAVPELEEAFDSALAGASVAADAGAVVLTAADLSAARDQGLAEGLLQGREAVQADISTELDNVRKEGYAEGLESGLENSSAQIEDLKVLLTSMSTRIENLQIRYLTALHRDADDERESRNRLLSLLDTKLIIKSDLDPSLHDRFETYTDTGGELRELEGREAVYAEILSFLSELAAEAGK